MNISPVSINNTDVSLFARHLNGQIREIELEKLQEHFTANKNKKSLKAKVALATGAAVLGGIALLSKGKFKALKPKTWGHYFKIDHAQNIIPLAAISTASGLLAGAVFDKSTVSTGGKEQGNIKPKLEEAVSQMVGNILIPITLLTGVQKLVKPLKLENKMPQFKDLGSQSGKFKKYLNGSLKMLPQAGLSILALGAGIIGGNIVANKLNALIFAKKEQRNIHPTDASAHLDDICLVATLVAPKNNICQKIGNLVPLALMIPGVAAGTAESAEPPRGSL